MSLNSAKLNYPVTTKKTDEVSYFRLCSINNTIYHSKSILLYYEAKECVHTSVPPPPHASPRCPSPPEISPAPRPSRRRARHPPSGDTPPFEEVLIRPASEGSVRWRTTCGFGVLLAAETWRAATPGLLCCHRQQPRQRL